MPSIGFDRSFYIFIGQFKDSPIELDLMPSLSQAWEFERPRSMMQTPLLFPLLLSLCCAAAFHPMGGMYPAAAGRPSMFFDLDNTLYNRTISEEETQRWAIEFIMSKIKCTPMQAEALLSKYRAKSYPAFVSAIVKELGVDSGDFEQYLDERLSNTLSPNKQLRELLGSMNANMYLMTNTGLGHAMGALNGLGISDMFNGVVYPDFRNPMAASWPYNGLYYDAMDYIGESNPANMYYLDDNASYARSARMAGWNAFHLARGMSSAPGDVPSIRSIYDIRRSARGLF